LERQARVELEEEGFSTAAVVVERTIDARYEGQSYELEVDAAPDWFNAFHAAHQQRFGFRRDDATVEAVTLRVTARASVTRPRRQSLGREQGPLTAEGTRVYIADEWQDIPLYLRESLRAGHLLTGPAVVAEYSATTWIPPAWRATVLDSGDLLLTRGD
jgi:N-methylhydantoinase A